MIYRIQNNKTGDWWDGEATGAKDACREAGWPMSVCWVRQKSNGGWKNPEDQPELGKATRKFQGKKVSESDNVTAQIVERINGVPEAEAEVVVAVVASTTAEIVASTVGVEDPTDMPEPEKTAWHNRLHIMQLARDAQVMFLKMGELLYNARENGEWSHLHYETFKEYIEDLALPMTNSYSWSTRLIGIWEYMAVKMGMGEEALLQIGVAKLSRLLPAARDGTLTDELLEKAVVLSDMDLRIELGHNVGEGGAGTESIVCPRCGQDINGARWVSGINAEPVRKVR